MRTSRETSSVPKVAPSSKITLSKPPSRSELQTAIKSTSITQSTMMPERKPLPVNSHVQKIPVSTTLKSSVVAPPRKPVQAHQVLCCIQYHAGRLIDTNSTMLVHFSFNWPPSHSSRFKVSGSAKSSAGT